MTSFSVLENYVTQMAQNDDINALTRDALAWTLLHWVESLFRSGNDVIDTLARWQSSFSPFLSHLY